LPIFYFVEFSCQTHVELVFRLKYLEWFMIATPPRKARNPCWGCDHQIEKHYCID